jgi:hypothetical protein
VRRLPGVLFNGIRAFRPSLFGDQPGSAAKLLTRDEACCIAANIGKLPQELCRSHAPPHFRYDLNCGNFAGLHSLTSWATTRLMRCSKQSHLFDHLVGAGKECRWHY